MKKVFLILPLVLPLLCSAAFGARPGDVNGDGIISVADAVSAARTAAGINDDAAPPEADVNQDGKIGIPEAVHALQWAAFIRRLAAPRSQFNIGDSIGEGEAADDVIRSFHHDAVWSTGYATGDTVTSLNERFEAADPEYYNENSALLDPIYNRAKTGADMADFAGQAAEVVEAAEAAGGAGMVTVLLGSNDVCADTLADMTDPAEFEAHFRAGLDVLAAAEATKTAQIHVSGIPDIYWLWTAKRNDLICQMLVWPYVPCQVLLLDPEDDCASDESRNDPDVIYAGDGDDCRRRKTFHQKIRDVYNPILRSVLQEYADSGVLPNAYYVDIFDVKFESAHVNDGDCFHPSYAGHALLAGEEWCRSHWGRGDPACAP